MLSHSLSTMNQRQVQTIIILKIYRYNIKTVIKIESHICMGYARTIFL